MRTRKTLATKNKESGSFFRGHQKAVAVAFCIILCSTIWLAYSDIKVKGETIFSDSFQYGDFSGWENTGGGIGWNYRPPSIGYGYDDSYSAQFYLDGTSCDPCYCWEPIGSQSLVYINLFFSMSALPDFNRGIDLVQLYSNSYPYPIGEVGIASYWDGSNQEITSNYVYLFLYTCVGGTGVILTPSTSEWHGLQIMFDNNDNVQDVWLDGSLIMESSDAVGYNVDSVKIGAPQITDYCQTTVGVDQVVITNSYIDPPGQEPTPTYYPWPTPISTPSPYPTPINVQPTNGTNQFEHVTSYGLYGYPLNDSYSMCCHYDYVPQSGGEQWDDAWTATGICAYYDTSQSTNVGYWKTFWSNQAASMQDNQCGPAVCHIGLVSMYNNYPSSHTLWNYTTPQYGLARGSPPNLYSYYTQSDDTFIFNSGGYIYDARIVNAYTFQNFYDLSDSSHIFFMESFTSPWDLIDCTHS
jgi:hypothetical protein